MADKAITDLTQATQITGEDLFVLEQSGEAKKLKGSQVVQYAKDSVAAEVQGVKEYADSAKASADAAAASAEKAAGAAQGIDDKVAAAETAKTDAQAARDAIVNMIVEAVTLETGKPATVTKSLVDNVYKLAFGLPRGNTGATGPQGATGNGISGIALKSGNHAPGTSDVYTITLTDGTTFDFSVYNGSNGQGSGDMLASVYDPQGKRTDVYKYVDDAIGKIPTPDVSAQIKAHNESTTAHPDIRAEIPTNTSQLTNDSGFLTQHQDISGKLDKTGDGSNVTAAFSTATTRSNIATSEKLSVLFGKIAKWFADLGSLAFKSTVAKSDLASDVQTSLGKADSALQSYTETDPTVPAWAKAKTKPNYSKSEVGLGNVDNVKQYSKDNPPPYPVTSVNGKTGAVTVPTVSVPSTTFLLKGDGSGGLVAASRGSDYIASGNIVKQTLVASESTPTENYAINWVYG